MNPSRPTIPPPLDDDHEDVAWALRAASAQWNRGSHEDAVAWVRRAAETAEEVSQWERAAELRHAATALLASAPTSPPKAVAPPPPRPGAAALPPPRAPQQSLDVEVVLDDSEEVDEVDEIDELLEDDIEFEEVEEEAAALPLHTESAELGELERRDHRGLADVFPEVVTPREPLFTEQDSSEDTYEDDASFGDRVSAPEVAYGETSLDELGLGDLSQLEDGNHRAVLGATEELESPFSDEAGTVRQDEFAEEEPPTAQMAAPPDTEPPGFTGSASFTGPPGFTGPPSEPPPPVMPQATSAFPPSGPPSEPFPLAPSALVPDVAELEVPEGPVSAAPVSAAPGAPASVDGVSLEEVSGLADLPEDSQWALARGADLLTLSVGEEARAFAVALVTSGAVDIMPAIADSSCARARRGEVVFTRGTLGDGVALRVVGAEDGTRVALWSEAQLGAATAACPWVADELAIVADRFQALAGAVMGPLGDRLDDMFRPMVLEKCTTRRFGPGEVLLDKGKAVDGMYIVGAGWVELALDDGAVAEELGPGDFLFRNTILMPGKATHTARAGQGGALVLYAPRMATHELLATCPPFIELVAG